MFDLCYKQRGETLYLKVTEVHLGNLNKKLLKKFTLFGNVMQQQSVFCWYKIGIEWEKYQIVFIAAALKTEQEVESIVSTCR